eukprot:TRINITY_DN946_c0_g1_i2.p1 TRINITY_DN946_c0_g1~~TRINITY_DN946_c0_g1_i2.p1  ORF type:complete len:107 (-),score=33.82 TRINITY_DN946_c0_g1_i2:23-343(-)
MCIRDRSKAAMAKSFKVGDKLEVKVSDPGGKFSSSVVGVCIARSRNDIRSSFKLLSTVLGEEMEHHFHCLLYTSDAADEEDSVDLGGRRLIKKKKRDENKDRTETQ